MRTNHSSVHLLLQFGSLWLKGILTHKPHVFACADAYQQPAPDYMCTCSCWLCMFGCSVFSIVIALVLSLLLFALLGLVVKAMIIAEALRCSLVCRLLDCVHVTGRHDGGTPMLWYWLMLCRCLKLTYHVVGVLPVCLLGVPYRPAEQNSAAQKQNGAVPKQERNPTIRISNSRQDVQ